MLNDLLLIKKVKEGDIKAFEILFRKYYPPLSYYAVTITGISDAAEDIIQDLFYHMWKERENIQIFSSLKSYLYSAVRNRSLQYCERRKLDERYRGSNLNLGSQATEPDSLNGIEYRELEQIIKKSLERMPSRRVEIFRMHRFGNQKYREIAEALSVSVKTVEAEMTKALKEIRKEIELHTSIL